MKTINYIKNEIDGGYIYPGKIKMGRSALGIIKELYYKNLSSLEGYIKSVRKMLNLKYKIPFFINDFYIFIYDKSYKDYETIFINYKEIRYIKKMNENICIHFHNDDVIMVNLSLNIYERLVMSISLIDKYKKSLL